jgi:hypothetical protein
MSERANQFGGNVLPPDGPSPSQLLVQEVAQELRQPGYPSPYEYHNLPVDAAAVRATLAESSLGDLLVAPGEKLEAVDHYERVHASITPGEDADLAEISVAAWETSYPKKRIVGPSRPNPYMARTDAEHTDLGDGYTEVEFPGQWDWDGYISLTLWHKPKDGSQAVGEVLALNTAHWAEGEMPTVESRVFVIPNNPDSQPKYYTRMARSARNPAEVTLLAETIRSLIPRPATDPSHPESQK